MGHSRLRSPLIRNEAKKGKSLPPRLVMFGAFGGTSVLNYAFGLVMGWLLVPGDFGLLAFAQTILLVGGLVLQSGFPWSLARAVANVDTERRDALVRGALLANLALSALMSAVVVLGFAAGPLQAGLESWSVTLLVAGAFPFISLVAALRGAAQGMEHFGVVATLQVTEILSKVVIGVALVLFGFGVLGAILGFMLGAIGAAALGFYLVSVIGVRVFGLTVAGGVEPPDVRFAAPMFGALLGISLLLNLDLAATKLLVEDREVAGYYQAGLILANAPYYLAATALLPVLFVQLARYRGVAGTQSAVGDTVAIAVALIVPFEVGLAVVPEATLSLLLPDESYTSAAGTLRLLAIGNMMLILTAILSTAFQAVGRAKVPALTLLSIALCETIVLRLLVPEWEARGAAVIFVVASGLAFSTLLVSYLWSAGVTQVNRAVRWMMRYALAVAAGFMAGEITFLLGAGPLTAAFIGGAFYMVLVLPLRLVRATGVLRKLSPRGQRRRSGAV